MAIYFEEENAHNKTRSFVPIDKWVVPDYSHRVGSRHVYYVGSIPVGMELSRASKSRPKKSDVPNASGTTIERQKSIMERERIPFVNPDRFSHLEREWRVLR
jgi:hypothetical protein